jgi:simple sugar transport system permease protein
MTALCVAIPARIGLVVIGGEGALVLGGLAAAAVSIPLVGRGAAGPRHAAHGVCAVLAGALWIGFAGFIRHRRGVNETIATLLLSYIAIAVMNFFVEGALRDPASANKPSTKPIGEAYMVGDIPGTDVHWGLVAGLLLCVVLHLLMTRTTFGFAARVTGGNPRAALAQGLPVGPLIVACTMIAGACAGLAGYFEVAAIHGTANASLVAGYGFTGILVSFLARHNALAIPPVALLFGGIAAAGGLIQRRMGLPDATVLLLQGIIFVVLLASETLYGRFKIFRVEGRRRARERDRRAGHRAARHAGRGDPRLDAVHVRGAGRVPDREVGPHQPRARGTLVLGAMLAYAVSYKTGSPWLGVLAAGCGGTVLGGLHGVICRLPKVNDVAVGIAMMLLGVGLAFFFGKAFIQPTAPRLPSIPLGDWSTSRSSGKRSRSTRCSSWASPWPC